MTKEYNNTQKQIKELFSNIDDLYDKFLKSDIYKKYSKYFENEGLTEILSDTRTNTGILTNENEYRKVGEKFLDSDEFKKFIEITSNLKKEH